MLGKPRADFRQLKRIVSIEHVLQTVGFLEHLKRRGNKLVGPCPIHHGDNPNAFIVDLERNIWHCFTRCRGGGDLIDFIRHLYEIPYSEVSRYLLSLNQSILIESSANLGESQCFKPFVKKIQLEAKCCFLDKKGITEKTAKTMETGVYNGKGFLENCVAVRIHDNDGQPLGYAGRRLQTHMTCKHGKWKFPPRLPKKQILYNFHRIRHLLNRGLVLVECPWGVMRLLQLGIPAVALLGVTVSTKQYELLRRSSSVVIMTDGDSAGKIAATQIYNVLKNRTNTVIENLPDGCDPDDLSDYELTHRISKYFLL